MKTLIVLGLFILGSAFGAGAVLLAMLNEWVLATLMIFLMTVTTGLLVHQAEIP